MTDTIEQKALALVAQIQEEDDGKKYSYAYYFKALCRAIEQHEAFRQEVSDAVKAYVGTDNYLGKFNDTLGRFIIAKPDPLVEIVNEVARDLHITGASTLHTFRSDDFRNALRAAIEKRGGKIVWGEG